LIPGLISLTPEELRLVSDAGYFEAKARIMEKVRRWLDEVHSALQAEVGRTALLLPAGFEPRKFQVVKGEHLEDCPYQYLDFPKHFAGDEKFTFRSLVWWGHHLVFALLLEGEHVLRYKQNLINRYHQVAGRDLCLSLAPTLWEWKRGEGYTLPLEHDRKSEVSAVLSGRRGFKIARFIPLDHPAVVAGRAADLAVETLRSLAPVMTS
jgi:hypothetical protein